MLIDQHSSFFIVFHRKGQAMWKDLKNRAKLNIVYILIGLLVFVKGWVFFRERNFFFFPPQWTWLMNNALFDGLMMATGLGLIILALVPYQNNKLLGILLSLIAAMLVIIICIEWEHVIFASQIKLEENIASNLFIVAAIVWTARHLDKR